MNDVDIRRGMWEVWCRMCIARFCMVVSTYTRRIKRFDRWGNKKLIGIEYSRKTSFVVRSKSDGVYHGTGNYKFEFTC